MKKTIFSALLLVSSAAVLWTSCGKNDNQNTVPAPTPEPVVLTISNGTAVTVDGKDAVEEVIVTASKTSGDNIIVLLTPENAEEGEVNFASNRLLIAAGETEVKTSVAFTAKSFPANTPEKNIGITVSSPTENVTIGDRKTAAFAVKGVDGSEMTTLKVTTPNGLSFDTTNEPGIAKVCFTLDSPLDFDLPVTARYDEDSDTEVTDASSWDPYPMKIPKGELSALQTITVKQNAAGNMKLYFNIEPGDNVKLDKDRIDFAFLKYNINIAPKDGTTVKVNRNNPAVRTFIVSMNNPAVNPIGVKLELKGDPWNGASISDNDILFAAGEQSKEILITFSNDVFHSKDVSETIRIEIVSSDVPVAENNGAIIYRVAGEKLESEKEQLKLEFKTDGTGDYPRDQRRMDLPYNNSGDGEPATRYDFWIGAKQSVKQVNNVIINVEVEGFSPDDYHFYSTVENGIYILAYDENAKLENWLFPIEFRTSAKGKNGKIIFTSDDATISSGEIIVTVK